MSSDIPVIELKGQWVRSTKEKGPQNVKNLLCPVPESFNNPIYLMHLHQIFFKINRLTYVSASALFNIRYFDA